MDADELTDEICEAASASEEIARKLEEIAEAAKDILSAGLTERAVILLLQDKSGVRRGDIQAVLHALTRLSDYTTAD